MTTALEFQTAVTKTVTNMDRLDDIINGDGTTTVVTDSGSVPSIRKLMDQMIGSVQVLSLPTWASLAGLTPIYLNQKAQVSLSDAGTHTGRTAASPGVDVASVPNSGVYGAYALTAGAWRRDGSLSSNELASDAETIARVSTTKVVTPHGLDLVLDPVEANVAANQSAISALQAELTDILTRILRTDGPGGVAFVDSLSRIMLQLREDGGVITPWWRIDPSGKGVYLLAKGNRAILAYDEDGAQVLGAVYVDQAGKITYRGLTADQVQPADTGAVVASGEFALVSGYAGAEPMDLPIHAGSLFGERAASDQAIISAQALTTAPDRPWAATSRSGSILLPWGKAKGTVRLAARRLRDLAADRGEKYDTRLIDLAIRSLTLPKVASPGILGIGDSLTERATMARIKAWLEAWGLTPYFVGTYASRTNPTNPSDMTGPMCEGRGGTRLDELWGLQLHGDPTNVQLVAPGEEAAFLALSNTAKKGYAPLARAATVGDAAETVSGGHTLDFTYYRSRFSQPPITQVFINEGTNDYSQAGGASARNVILELLPKTIACIRRDLGSIPIILWTCTEARNSLGEMAWADHLMMLQAVTKVYNSLKGSDPNLHLCPTHLVQDEHLGWLLNTGSTDAATGVRTTTLSDRLHPADTNLEMHALALAALSAYYA